MCQDGAGHRVGLVEVGEMAGIGHRLHPGRAVDAAGELLRIGRAAVRRRARPTGSGSAPRSGRAAFPAACCRAARRRGRRLPRRASSRSAIRPSWRPRAARPAPSISRRRRTSGRARLSRRCAHGSAAGSLSSNRPNGAIRQSLRTCAGKIAAISAANAPPTEAPKRSAPARPLLSMSWRTASTQSRCVSSSVWPVAPG